MASWSRTVLGGSMHGQVVQILHGAKMVSAQSGDEYRRYTDAWWVPAHDTDQEAAARVFEYVSDWCKSTAKR